MTPAAYLLGLLTGLLAAYVLRVIWGEIFRESGSPECADSTWLPYEDEEGFGYVEWRCQRARGHIGKHEGWLRD